MIDRSGHALSIWFSKPVFAWNLVDLKRPRWEGTEALAPGKHTVEFDFKYDGLGAGTLAFNNLSGIADFGPRFNSQNAVCSMSPLGLAGN